MEMESFVLSRIDGYEVLVRNDLKFLETMGLTWKDVCRLGMFLISWSCTVLYEQKGYEFLGGCHTKERDDLVLTKSRAVTWEDSRDIDVNCLRRIPKSGIMPIHNIHRLFLAYVHDHFHSYISTLTKTPFDAVPNAISPLLPWLSMHRNSTP